MCIRDSHEGMCIFHQPGIRNITIVFRGDTQNEFSTRIQDEMLDKCKTYLKDDDPLDVYKRQVQRRKRLEIKILILSCT